MFLPAIDRCADGMLHCACPHPSCSPIPLPPPSPSPCRSHPPLVTTPWMTCFTWLQKEEWTAADGTFKLHKSKLELAKEEAAAARSPLTACLHTMFAVLKHVDSSTPGLMKLDAVTRFWPLNPLAPLPNSQPQCCKLCLMVVLTEHKYYVHQLVLSY